MGRMPVLLSSAPLHSALIVDEKRRECDRAHSALIVDEKRRECDRAGQNRIEHGSRSGTACDEAWSGEVRRPPAPPCCRARGEPRPLRPSLGLKVSSRRGRGKFLAAQERSAMFTATVFQVASCRWVPGGQPRPPGSPSAANPRDPDWVRRTCVDSRDACGCHARSFLPLAVRSCLCSYRSP